ncbi:MAG: xanthine dehydrogenase family protein subunit M [Candidatus Methanomethylicaceae archaeon]
MKTNTHILAQEFEYLEPRTIDEALQYLSQYGKRAKIIAGGTDLLVKMKMGEFSPEVLINITKIPNLRYLIEDRGLRIGALTRFHDIEESSTVKGRWTALYEAARSVSSTQIKRMGTVGGNLCHASPAADSPPSLIIFGSEVRLLGEKGERVLPLEEFFIGPGETILFPDELLVEIRIPEKQGRMGSAFLKLGRVASDLSKVNVAVALIREGGICRDCRIALGSVAPTPLRAKKGEEIIKGQKVTDALIEKVGNVVSEEIQPIDDIRSTAWYRKEVTKVLVRDALKLAWERAS